MRAVVLINAKAGTVVERGGDDLCAEVREAFAAAGHAVEAECCDPADMADRIGRTALRTDIDAIVAGVNIVEDDPDDSSVGYGGLPNEECEVELDASVMHGPSRCAGAVANLQLNVFDDQTIEHLLAEDILGWQCCTAFGDGLLHLANACVQLALHDYVVVDNGHDAIEGLYFGLRRRTQKQCAQQ